MTLGLSKKELIRSSFPQRSRRLIRGQQLDFRRSHRIGKSSLLSLRNATTVLAFVATLSLTAFERTDAVREAQWFLDALKIDKAHALSTGTGVTVALTDSGVNNHRDFDNNLVPGVDLVTNSGPAYNNDRIGHGTEMAGLIVGHGQDSAKGVLGIAPGSKLLPIKVSDGPDFRPIVGAGISAATNLGARVINVSSAGSISKELERAVNDAINRDVVVVAASGNDFRTARIGYPAALPGVLAVGAVDKDGKYAPFSTPGPNLGICAPGVDIVTTGSHNSYSKIDGTSAATAIVSGAAALVRANFPKLSAREVVHRLTATATDIGPPGRDEQCGYGVLNIIKALTADVPPMSNGTSVGAGASSSAVVDGAHNRGRGWKFGLLGRVAVALSGGVVLAFLAVRRRNRRRI
ncbi:S8 family serine peptidase [Actinoplanes sp. NPDC020271]|uniref:S8 family serine peptidase n=1 Tax=Actinoplanes sp. NPDC020271 TaxID=3363896 RepID=UPI00378AD35E